MCLVGAARRGGHLERHVLSQMDLPAVRVANSPARVHGERAAAQRAHGCLNAAGRRMRPAGGDSYRRHGDSSGDVGSRATLLGRRRRQRSVGCGRLAHSGGFTCVQLALSGERDGEREETAGGSGRTCPGAWTGSDSIRMQQARRSWPGGERWPTTSVDSHTGKESRSVKRCPY